MPAVSRDAAFGMFARVGYSFVTQETRGQRLEIDAREIKIIGPSPAHMIDARKRVHTHYSGGTRSLIAGSGFSQTGTHHTSSARVVCLVCEPLSLWWVQITDDDALRPPHSCSG